MCWKQLILAYHQAHCICLTLLNTAARTCPDVKRTVASLPPGNQLAVTVLPVTCICCICATLRFTVNNLTNPPVLQFVQQHLSVDSTQRYVRDVLNQWAALQSFAPSLPENWDCLLSPVSEMFWRNVGETHLWMKHVQFYNCSTAVIWDVFRL